MFLEDNFKKVTNINRFVFVTFINSRKFISNIITPPDRRVRRL